jgi:hypothetical protein
VSEAQRVRVLRERGELASRAWAVDESISLGPVRIAITLFLGSSLLASLIQLASR